MQLFTPDLLPSIAAVGKGKPIVHRPRLSSQTGREPTGLRTAQLRER